MCIRDSLGALDRDPVHVLAPVDPQPLGVRVAVRVRAVTYPYARPQLGNSVRLDRGVRRVTERICRARFHPWIVDGAALPSRATTARMPLS